MCETDYLNSRFKIKIFFFKAAQISNKKQEETKLSLSKKKNILDLHLEKRRRRKAKLSKATYKKRHEGRKNPKNEKIKDK